AELVEALMDYDLIGFQARDHVEAFVDYIQAAGGEAHPDGRVALDGKTSRIGAFPIGIDAADFAGAVASEPAHDLYARMRESLAGRRMILGVDRLDYSKGLEDRFLAYEQFLHDNPGALEQVFMLQVATASREDVEAYQDLR